MCCAPPTAARPCLGSTNSISPAHSFSISSRLRAWIRRSTSSSGLAEGTVFVGSTSLTISSAVIPAVMPAKRLARSAASGAPASSCRISFSRSASDIAPSPEARIRLSICTERSPAIRSE